MTYPIYNIRFSTSGNFEAGGIAILKNIEYEEKDSGPINKLDTIVVNPPEYGLDADTIVVVVEVVNKSEVCVQPLKCEHVKSYDNIVGVVNGEKIYPKTGIQMEGNDPKISIGIDPGKEGAIVVIEGDEVWKFLFPKIGTDYDISGIAEILGTWKESGINMVVMENIHALPSVGAKSNWSLSRGKAIIETTLTMLNIPFTMISPKKWQKQMWEGVEIQKTPSKKNKSGWKTDTKATSLMAAKRLFPDEDLTKSTRSQKPHDGIIDALLMAEYARRNF